MFRLARDLGKTVKQIANQVSSYELVEWMAYYKLETDTHKEQQEAAAKQKKETQEKKKAEQANFLKQKMMAESRAYNKNLYKKNQAKLQKYK